MFSSILLPLDGSSFAEEAVPMAAAVARAFGARLHMTHVIRPMPGVGDGDASVDTDMKWRRGVREAASGALSEIAGRLRQEGLEVDADVREGEVVPEILGALEEEKGDLVVMTTHGAGGFRRWWLGSVADSLLRQSRVPILLVRPWDDTRDRPSDEPRFRTILVPLDGSSSSEVALESAVALARADRPTRMVLVRVVPSPLDVGTLYGIPRVRAGGEAARERKEEARSYLEKVADRLPTGELEGVELRVMEASSAAEGIIEAARLAAADLVVISSAGRGGFGRVVLGSVADKVIRGATPPALVVHPPED
ncbi:MAG: universal stress protein [Gemmatimonadales bacterium]|nr:MAG: universal stress protein [Gemmatimonadales bacterium]